MHENVIGFEGGVQMHLHLSGTLMPLAVFTPLRSSPCRAAEDHHKANLPLLLDVLRQVLLFCGDEYTSRL